MNIKHLQFNVSARTAKLIGLENFANAEGAIIELVKNAYDADSEICAVIFDIRDTRKDSSIYILDTGVGMNDEIISRHWMTIGTDDKLKNSKTSEKGRVKSGAKGIGRFALNKLGRRSSMLTFPKNDSKGFYWTIDWSDFDKDGYTLSDIKAELSEIDNEFLAEKIKEYGFSSLDFIEKICLERFHGTLICITDLNDSWDDESLTSLNQNLETLIPSHLSSDFLMYLYSISDTSKYGRINSDEYNEYDYKIDASYLGEGRNSIKVKITRKELNLSLLESSYSDLFSMSDMQKFPYRLADFQKKIFEKEVVLSDDINPTILNRIGPFSFMFYFIKNSISDDPDELSKRKYPYNSIDSRQRRSWLKKFGGVKIFRDDFRVRPYGENGDDWLGLGNRHSLSPAGVGSSRGGYRIRPNQIAGAVSISRLYNSSFEDRSSREGLQENDEFKLLKNILLKVIEAFENDRNTVMYNLSSLYKAKHPESATAKSIADKYDPDSVSSSNDEIKGNCNDDSKNINDNNRDNCSGSEQTNELVALAKGYKTLQNELHEKEEENRMLRSLASTGVAVASFTHELHGMSDSLLVRSDLLKETLKNIIKPDSIEFENKLDNPFYLIDLMKNQDIKLHQWLDYSLNAIKRNKRDRGDLSIKDYFGRLGDSWKEPLTQKNITLKITPDPKQTDSDCILNCFEMDLDSIFNNFITNSVSSLLRTPRRDKEIIIEWKTDSQFLVIDFIDNGLGLASEYKTDPYRIFNAFETSSCDKKGNKIGTGMGLFIVKSVIDSYRNANVSLLNMENVYKHLVTDNKNKENSVTGENSIHLETRPDEDYSNNFNGGFGIRVMFEYTK